MAKASEPSVRSRILFVTASPRRDESHSIRLAETFLDAYRGHHHGLEVDRLDTFRDLTPFVTGHVEAKMAVIEGRPVPETAAGAWAEVLALGERVRAADTLLFAVPMWNGSIPWSLKLFIDTVTQPGVAFRFDPAAGYSGLLGGRRAVTVYTSRVYSPGVATAFGVDHQSTYLRWWLRYCGIADVHELRLQPTYPGEAFPAQRAHADASASDLARRLASSAVAAVR